MGDQNRSDRIVLEPLSRLGSRVRAAEPRRLDVATLGRQASMSPRTLARRFRQETGTSPGQWVLEQRTRAYATGYRRSFRARSGPASGG